MVRPHINYVSKKIICLNDSNVTTFSFQIPKYGGSFQKTARPILQLLATALCVVSQPLNRKNLTSKFTFEAVSGNCFMKTTFIFC